MGDAGHVLRFFRCRGEAEEKYSSNSRHAESSAARRIAASLTEMGQCERTELRRFQSHCAVRGSNRYRRTRAASFLGIIDQGPQFFREFAVTESRLVGSNLHGDGEETVVVAVHMRLQQRLDLLSAGHVWAAGAGTR